MTIFYRDVSETKRTMLEAIEKHRVTFAEDKYARQGAFYELQLAIEEGASAVGLKSDFENHVGKLVLAGQHERARKLVGVIPDRIMRLWLAIPIMVIMWPFVFVWRLLKMGVPR